MPYGENHGLDKLYSCVNYSAVGYEFNANESKINNKVSLNRSIRKTRLCIDWLMKMACRNLCISCGDSG